MSSDPPPTITYIFRFTVRRCICSNGEWLCTLDPGGITYGLGTEKPTFAAGDLVELTIRSVGRHQTAPHFPAP